MSRGLERRLARLEQRLGPIDLPGFVVVVKATYRKQRDSLAPDERIVHDWFRRDNGYVLARERSTANPDDEGQRCEPGGCLMAVIQELHETCEFREGGCRICAGWISPSRSTNEVLGSVP